MHSGRFKVEPLGDSAVLIEAPAQAAALANNLEAVNLPGVTEVVPAFDSVAVLFDPGVWSDHALEEALESFVPSAVRSPQWHRVPVQLDRGQDTVQACQILGLSETELAQCLEDSVLECRAVGFCPGFPYLGWLPERLSGLTRKASPLVRVPVGSVAIVGRMAGIYTQLRPGGWWLIGQTPLTLVDVEDRYFPIAVGDRVQFTPIGDSEFECLLGERL